MESWSLVEGVGDEVIWAALLLLVLLLLSLAWLSTGVRPLWGADSVWYVQLQPGPQRRVLRLLHIEEATPEQLRPSDPATQTLAIPAEEVAERDRSPDTGTNAGPVSDDSVTSASATAESSLSESETEEQTAETSEPNDNDKPQPAPSPPSPHHPVFSTAAGDAQIKLKFLDETQRLVGTFLSRTVGDFKREHFETEVSSGQVIRLIYQGQLLRDDARSLESYGLTPGAILHCHVSNTPLQGSSSSPNSNNNNANSNNSDEGGALGLGRYIYVLFGAKFMAFWVFYFYNPGLFNFTSLASLIMVTLVYVACLVGFWLQREALQPYTDVNTLGYLVIVTFVGQLLSLSHFSPLTAESFTEKAFAVVALFIFCSLWDMRE